MPSSDSIRQVSELVVSKNVSDYCCLNPLVKKDEVPCQLYTYDRVYGHYSTIRRSTYLRLHCFSSQVCKYGQTKLVL